MKDEKLPYELFYAALTYMLLAWAEWGKMPFVARPTIR